MDLYLYGVAIAVMLKQHGLDENIWCAYITLCGFDVIFLWVIILHLVDGAAG